MNDMSSTVSIKWSLTFVILSACVTKQEREVKTPGPRIDRVTPDKVMAGKPFQVQPDGQSAISITGEHLIRGSRVRINGEPIVTAWSDDGKSLSAIVPPEKYAQAGMYPLSVESPSGELSNAIPFTVLPQSGPAPEITKLYPDKTETGKPFNEQPGGKSALGIVGRNFLPGAVVELNGEPQETSFGDVDQVAAVVPGKFTAKPGRLRVTVRNVDGKQSVPAELIVAAP
jgi:hypothetical protein